jgi:hypothetical protein
VFAITSAAVSEGITAVYCTPVVRFLRMSTNSLAAGVLTAAYVLVLFSLLNPSLSRNPRELAACATTLGVFYAVWGSAAAYVLLLGRALFGRVRFSPAWISVTVVAWLAAAASAGGALLMWANLRTFSLVLEATTVRGLTRSAIVMAAVSGLLLLTAVLQRRGAHRRVLAAWVVSLCVTSIAVPLALADGRSAATLDTPPLGELVDVPPADRPARVTIIALDAGSLEFITNATSEGRLPNFGRILDAGAVAHLATLHPTSADAVWAAVATGKLPQKNGVRSAAVYRLAGRPSSSIELLPDFCFAAGLARFGLLTEEPRTSASLRTRPLWTILSAARLRVGVVNLPLTSPASAVRGFMVSDTWARHDERAIDRSGSNRLYPADLEDMARASRAGTGVLPAPLNGLAERYRAAILTDRLYERVYQALAAADPVDVSMRRFQSFDVIGHYFLRYAMPQRFGDVSDEDRRRFGGVLEAEYTIVDEALGVAIETLGPDDLLLVMSPYGMEPLSIGKRLIELLIGDPETSGSHEGAPDGFLMAYGASVARTRQLRRASVVDVLPTVLYYLGLPVARDMDGYARADLFLQSFTDERPITFIPTYDR